MATIGRGLWGRYSGSLDDAARKAASFVSRSIRAFVAANPKASVADVRRAGEDALRAACDAYGLQAAELAALMYDEVARICGIEGDVDPAEPSDGSTFEEEAAKVAHYQAGKLAAGDTAGFIAQMGDAAADQVLDRANRTFIENAMRPADKAAGMRFARILTGLENCTFCTMLASRGFVYSTWDNAYQTGRRHRNCDCRVVSGTPGTDLEGYDLDAVTEQWQTYEEIDARTHEDGTPWTAEEKRAAKSEWSREHPVWKKSGRRQSGATAGALNDVNDPKGIRRTDHAKRFYREVVNRDRAQTIGRISSVCGLSEEVVARGFSHLFLEKHDLAQGYKFFDQDYDMAQSIQRILDGRPERHDLLLFAHEELESRYMAAGMPYTEAHEKANETYNYEDALDDWLDGRRH